MIDLDPKQSRRESDKAFFKGRGRQHEWVVIHSVVFCLLLIGGLVFGALSLKEWDASIDGMSVIDSGFLTRFIAGVVGWGICVVAYFMWIVKRIHSDAMVSLRFYQGLLDHRGRCPTHQDIPAQRRDEFGDFARYLDSVLVTMGYDYQSVQQRLTLLVSSLEGSQTAKVLVNERFEVIAMSNGFIQLWDQGREALSKLINADTHLDSLIGEVLDVSFVGDKHLTLINGQRYEMSKIPLEDNQGVSGMLLEWRPHQVNAELQALTANINLLAMDSWQMPIRLLDMDSSLYPHTVKLEAIRQQVNKTLVQISDFCSALGLSTQKITKLQQLEGVLANGLETKFNANDVVERWQSEHLTKVVTLQGEFELLAQHVDRQAQELNEYSDKREATQSHLLHQLEFVRGAVSDMKSAIIQWVVPGAVQNPNLVRAHAIDLSHDIDTVIAAIAEVYESLDDKLSDQAKLPDVYQLIGDMTKCGDEILNIEAHIKKLSQELKRKDNVSALTEQWDEF